jgi:spore germination protein
MNLHLNRRTVVRLLSFSLAVILVLGILAFQNLKRAQSAERQLEYQYLKSIDDLGNYLENIEATLTKTIYSGTPASMANLTSKIWRETGFAKECVSTLPMSELNLEKTYKFLSQLGDYTVSLSKKVSQGHQLTKQERDNLVQMKDYATKFLQQVLVTQDGVRTGTISFQEVKHDAAAATAVSGRENFSDGFLETEDGFTAYPTLIYDGPFSDHILEKEPEMIKNAKEVTREEAKTIAAKALNTSSDKIVDDTDEEGNMPSYCFAGPDANLAVTKQGGLLSYLIKNRTVESQDATADECVEAALEYLKSLGVSDMKKTYYEIAENIITINFASQQGDVTCYTDLIKVSVAMDNKEILKYDGRGYITNHKTREHLTAEISVEEAQKSLSPLLTVEQCNLTLIPTSGQNEVLCYEFKCHSDEDENILVYVNAKTGAEENLLLLSISENGTLTL